MTTSPSFRDLENLSVYLDGGLRAAESRRLESRLASDPGLRAALDEIRQTRALLRRLPARRAPRNFTLTPKMAGLRPAPPRAYPVLRLASALATFFLIVTAVTDFLGSVTLGASTPMMAVEQAVTMEAVAAPGMEAVILPTETPALPSGTPEATPETAYGGGGGAEPGATLPAALPPSARVAEVTSTPSAKKAAGADTGVNAPTPLPAETLLPPAVAAPEQEAALPPEAPPPALSPLRLLEILLAVVAVTSGGAAFFLRRK